MQPETKRQNFNITPEQEAELNWLRGALGAPTAKEAILRAIHVLAAVARDLEEGGRLYVHDSSGKITRVIIPELETAGRSPWKYLVERPHPWRRQMYLKGRRLLASTVWSDLRANGMSLEEAAENWNLPREAVEECMRYGEANADLIRMEAEEEGARLLASGGVVHP